MSRAPTAYVFMDANVALHFKQPDQIDWRALTNAKEVVLIAAPVLLRELENQKVVNGSAKLRARAADYIKWLHPFVRDPETEVRTGVRWLFLPDEPQLDFAAECLSQTIADDHLIASVLHYTRQSAMRALVATVDLGLEVKLRARGIGVLELTDDLRLPVELDPLERENKDLKKQLARLQARMPKLSVVFKGGTQHHVLSFRDPTAFTVVSLEQVRADNPYISGLQAPVRSQASIAALSNIPRLTQQFGLSAERKDQYNEELDRYFELYQGYIDSHAAWCETVSLHHLIKFIVNNDGTAPASNIDLDLFFPDGIQPVDGDDLPEEPKPPRAPRRPQGILDYFGNYGVGADYLPSLMRTNQHQLINRNDDGVPIIGDGRDSVRIGYSNLKHGFNFTSDELIFRFTEAASVRAFSVDYCLSADELPEALEGKLHFRIDNAEA